MTRSLTRLLKHYIILTVFTFAIISGGGLFNSLLAGTEETYKGLKVFSEVIEEVEKNYVDSVDGGVLIQKAIQGMVRSLDPHSSFLTPEMYSSLQDDTKGEFSGIGIVIAIKDDVLTVVSSIEGTPAHRAGVTSDDKIVKVDGTSTLDLTISEAVKMIKGPKGTPVKITVIREGEPEPLEFRLLREDIPLESVRAADLKPGYGYIWITNFNEHTTHDLETELVRMESGKVPLRGLILDLRANPGGLLEQSTKVADLFLEEGVIVSIKGRLKEHTQSWNAHPNTVKRDYPVVVLINGGSASASEIVAGALQDHKRALILGTTSFGKGSVQTVKPLKDGYALKYTIARYYTPQGRSIQAQGIEPDITLKFRRIEEDEDGKTHFSVKEKDLKNHLEAEGAEKEEIEEADLPGTEYGELNKKELMKDNQVVRALELLISQDIFGTYRKSS